MASTGTLVTRIDNPWLLLATLPLYHPVQDLKMTPVVLQSAPAHFLNYASLAPTALRALLLVPAPMGNTL